jgi:hypothetical protein
MFNNKNAIILCFTNLVLLHAIDKSFPNISAGTMAISLIVFFPLVFILPEGDWKGGFSMRAMRSYEGASEESMKFFGWVLIFIIFIGLFVRLVSY